MNRRLLRRLALALLLALLPASAGHASSLVGGRCRLVRAVDDTITVYRHAWYLCVYQCRADYVGVWVKLHQVCPMNVRGHSIDERREP